MRYRFQKLQKLGVLRFDVFARQSKLGLAHCAFFANASPEGGDVLEKTFEAVKYWRYRTRCYGSDEGLYGIYDLPYANRSDLQRYWQEAVELGVAKDFRFIYTGDSFNVTPDFQWFNFKQHFWRFPWEDWVEETKRAPSKPIHPSLTDPKDYVSHLDEADIKIIALLEFDATRGLSEIATHLGFTTSGAKYHWDNHIVAQGVVQGYRTVVSGYPLGFTDLFVFHFRCRDAARLSQLVNFLFDKVFVVSFSKVLRENELIVHISLPKTEFEGLMMFMYGVRRAGIIQDFSYWKLDLSGFAAETISPSNYTEGYWSYDLDSHLERLQSIASKKAAGWQPKGPSRKGSSPLPERRSIRP